MRIAGFLPIVVVLLAAIAPGAGWAQEFPSRPLRWVVPSGPGNPMDTLSRAMAQEVAKIVGQAVVIENKPGAGGLVGYEYVAKRVPADGYALVTAQPDALASLPVTVKDIQVDLQKDLAPIMSLASGRLVLAVSATRPWKTFNELVADARANPGKLNYGSMSKSTAFFLEIVSRDLGLGMFDVPFGGNLPAYSQALSEGTAHSALMSETTFGTFGDKLRALAITGDQRSPAMPQLPTFRELGFPQITGFGFSVNTTGGTPAPIVEKLNAAMARALQQPGVRATLARLKLDAAPDTSPQATARALSELSRTFADAAQRSAYKPQ